MLLEASHFLEDVLVMSILLRVSFVNEFPEFPFLGLMGFVAYLGILKCFPGVSEHLEDDFSLFGLK